MSLRHLDEVKPVVHAWAENLAFFPHDPDAQAEIGARVAVWLAAGTRGLKQLLWLREAVLTHMPQWKGIEALRTLFCGRFKLPDGIEKWAPERGTYYLDDLEARRLLDSPPEPVRYLPGPRDEHFDLAAFEREAAESYNRAKAQVAPERPRVVAIAAFVPAVKTKPQNRCALCHGLGEINGGYCSCVNGIARQKLDHHRSTEKKPVDTAAR